MSERLSERLSDEERAAIRSAAFIGPTLYGIVEAILAAHLADQAARLAAAWYEGRAVGMDRDPRVRGEPNPYLAALHPDPSEART